MLELNMIMQELERTRKETITILVASIATIVVGFSFLIRFLGWGILIIISGFAALIVCAVRNGKYKKRVKEELAIAVLQQHYDHVTLDVKSGFSHEYIRSTEMLGLGNIYSSNDLLKGGYKGVDFEQADLLIQQQTSTGKSTVTVTLFKGQYRIFEFNKNFTSYLQIRDKEGALFGKNAKPYQFFTQREKTTHLKLENKEFNGIFDVYASDAHEAFYILTPHFMEKIMELNTLMDCTIVIGFIDNRMHMASYTNQDLFEPSLFSQINEEYLKKIEQEAEIIKQIIDELDLS